jgi:hypothetical protein
MPAVSSNPTKEMTQFRPVNWLALAGIGHAIDAREIILKQPAALESIANDPDQRGGNKMRDDLAPRSGRWTSGPRGAKSLTRLIRLLVVVPIILTPVVSWAQAAPELGVVTTLQGQASVARASAPRALPLKFKDAVFDRDRIQTGEESIVKVLMGGKAIVTVRELSVLTITEELGKTTINLASGKIAVGVAKQRMKPGERLEVHTPNAVAAVRGTVFVVEVTRQGAQLGSSPLGAHTQVTTVHGAVEVGSPSQPGQTTLLTPSQSVGLVGVTLGQVRTLSVQDMGRLLGGFTAPLPTGLDPRSRQAMIHQEQNKLLALTGTASDASDSGPHGLGCASSCQAPILPPIVIPSSAPVRHEPVLLPAVHHPHHVVVPANPASPLHGQGHLQHSQQ